MNNITSNRPRIYKMGMENFERDLDSLLDSLLSLKSERDDRFMDVQIDSPHESLWPKKRTKKA